MLRAALNEKDEFVLPYEAIEARDTTKEEHSYKCLCHDEIVFPRKGVEKQPSDPDGSLHVKRKPHFVHPESITLPRKSDLDIARNAIKKILLRTGDFLDYDRGTLTFRPGQAEDFNPHRSKDFFDYGFEVLYFGKESKAYVVLVVADVPHTGHHWNSLKYSFDKGIEKYLTREEGRRELNDQIYFTTVQLKNNKLWKPNREDPARENAPYYHPENAVILGDWQAYDLLKIHPEFNFFDVENLAMDVTTFKRWEHECSHARARHSHKRSEPENAPLECQLATVREYPLFSLEPFRIKTNSFYIANKKNPSLGIGRITERMSGQGLLFGPSA